MKCLPSEILLRRPPIGDFTGVEPISSRRYNSDESNISMDVPKKSPKTPVPKQGAYLRSVVAGHVRYYGVPMNRPSTSAFREAVCRLWFKVLRRRSHKHNLTWKRMERLIAKWIPLARICHPYPLIRFGVIT